MLSMMTITKRAAVLAMAVAACDAFSVRDPAGVRSRGHAATCPVRAVPMRSRCRVDAGAYRVGGRAQGFVVTRPLGRVRAVAVGRAPPLLASGPL